MTKEKNNGHIGVGLVGVPILTEWAVRNKAVDFMYNMLKKRDYPGYLYMIDNDATTTWEYWSGERSRIHNCYNGIGTWFYEAIGGIRPDESNPGYKHVFIEPQIPEGLSWAKITKETPYGTIRVDWKIEAHGQSELNIVLPPGVTATVNLPEEINSYTLNGERVK
jgi:alpha-L-rhamnosidase